MRRKWHPGFVVFGLVTTVMLAATVFPTGNGTDQNATMQQDIEAARKATNNYLNRLDKFQPQR